MAKSQRISRDARKPSSRPPAPAGRPGRRKLAPTDPLAADLAAIRTRLTEAREARGLSGRALARMSGVNNPGSIEHGRPLALVTAFRLADALGVRRGWLILGEGPRDLVADPSTTLLPCPASAQAQCPGQ